MGPSGKTGQPTDADQGAATSLVTVLVTALKNIAIYPATHPRVVTAAAEFVACLARRCDGKRSCLLVLRGDVLLLDEERLEPDGTGIDWLLQRCREAGLRGIEFTNECSADDVLAFATALNHTRVRSGTTFFGQWTDPNPRLVPLPMVFQGHHDANAASATPDDGQPTATTTATAYLSPKARADARVRAVIDRMSSTTAVQERLRAIAGHTRNGAADGSKTLDLFDVIADLLPADVANDPAVIEDVVGRVLGRVEESLGELVRRKAKVKGADLLRKALGVARKFFHTEAPKQVMPAGMPSGRPEDEKIVADLDLLLQEIDQLPDAQDLRLPTADEMANTSHLVAREVFGVCLHRVANSDGTTAMDQLTERLKKARAGVLADVADLLAAYAGPAAGSSAAAMATRRKVLGALIECNHVALLRERGFVDASFVTRGFPETLPLAAVVLGDDEAGRATLREALEAVAPLLAAGGVTAAEAAGVLADPVVVKALTLTGGPVASALLVQAATKAQPAIRAVLRDYLRGLDLPAAAAAVVHSYENAEALPRDYLHCLLGAVLQQRFDPPVLAASAAMLRRRVLLPPEQLHHEARLAAIAHLAHAPGPETRALLEKLAREGRFRCFSAKARAIRRAARTTLAALGKEPPS